jgi:chromosome segregation ATPase
MPEPMDEARLQQICENFGYHYEPWASQFKEVVAEIRRLHNQLAAFTRERDEANARADDNWRWFKAEQVLAVECEGELIAERTAHEAAKQELADTQHKLECCGYENEQFLHHAGQSKLAKEKVEAELAALQGRLDAWNSPSLQDWDVGCINHYRQNGKRHLFVLMTRGGIYIKAESVNEDEVWDSLKSQAAKVRIVPDEPEEFCNKKER